MDDTKPPNNNGTKLTKQPSDTSTKRTYSEQLFDAIRLTAETCGCPLSTEAIVMFVKDLEGYEPRRILASLKRCREEIKPEKGFVTFNLAILIDKMGIPKGEDLLKAEAEVQWDLLNENLRFYDDTPGCYWIKGIPELSAKASAALRRIGGWQKLEHWAKREDWHFTKRDFVNSYLNHEDIEYATALPSGTRGQLTHVATIIKRLPED